MLSVDFASLSHYTSGMVGLAPKWVRLATNGTNPGLFQIRFQCIWLPLQSLVGWRDDLKLINHFSTLGRLRDSELERSSWWVLCLVWPHCLYMQPNWQPCGGRVIDIRVGLSSQISPKWDKSGTCVGLWLQKNVLKLILKSQICPIWSQPDTFWMPNLTSLVSGKHSQYYLTTGMSALVLHWVKLIPNGTNLRLIKLGEPKMNRKAISSVPTLSHLIPIV